MKRLGVLWILALALVVGCSRAEPELRTDARKLAAPVGALAPHASRDRAVGAGLAERTEADAEEKAASKLAPGQPAAPAQPAAQRYLVRKATLNLEVQSVGKAVAALRTLIKHLDGYLGDEDVDTTSGQVAQATLTLRVPASRLDDLLNQSSGLGQVLSRQLSAEDVTTEYVDTDARLRNLQREEAQYLTVLSAAHSIRDILSVERELSRVRGEIELTTSRLKALSNLVSLATVVVNLTERVTTSVSSPWDLGPAFQNSWHQAQDELAQTVGALVSGTIHVAVAVLPVLLPLLLLYLLVGLGVASVLRWRAPQVSQQVFWLGWSLLGYALIGLRWPILLGIAVLVGAVGGVTWLIQGRLARAASPPAA